MIATLLLLSSIGAPLTPGRVLPIKRPIFIARPILAPTPVPTPSNVLQPASGETAQGIYLVSAKTPVQAQMNTPARAIPLQDFQLQATSNANGASGMSSGKLAQVQITLRIDDSLAPPMLRNDITTHATILEMIVDQVTAGNGGALTVVVEYRIKNAAVTGFSQNIQGNGRGSDTFTIAAQGYESIYPSTSSAPGVGQWNQSKNLAY